MSLLEINNFSFRYALCDRDALDGIELSVNEGELILLCGDTGSGKSTLLNCIKREVTPAGKSTGCISFDGKNITELSDFDSAFQIGLVRQDAESQIVCDTVYSELAFGLRNLRFPAGVIRRRIAEISGYLGMGSWMDKKTDRLSGGQKQLLCIASVLVMQPRLLMLDEPTAQLDPVASGELMSILDRLCREMGLTVILCEHRLEEAFPVCSRVVYMNDGRTVLCDTPEKLCRDIAVDDPFYGNLPSAARIYREVSGNEGNIPVTVCSGREYLKKTLGDKKFGVPTFQDIKELHKNDTPAIETKNLRFGFQSRGREIISGLDLKLYGGEITCIFGENGSGKTTLLRLIAGFLKPTGGKIKILKDLKVAYLPQNPKAVFCCDNVFDELYITAADFCKQGENAEDTVKEKLRAYRLEGLEKRHPYDLSGGQQQRLALLKLSLTNPDIYLLDEPTKGLDLASKKETADIFRRFAEGGRAVIMVSHDTEFAAKYCDRCIMLFMGEAAADETTRSFFSRNCFYTTAAARIASDFDSYAITVKDVTALCAKEK